MKTRREVIDYAMRKIGVLAEDEALTASQLTQAEEVLEALYGEIEAEAAPGWTIDTVPQSAFIPLGNLLAVDLAPAFNRPPVASRGMAWVRALAQIRPYVADPDAEQVYY